MLLVPLLLLASQAVGQDKKPWAPQYAVQVLQFSNSEKGWSELPQNKDQMQNEAVEEDPKNKIFIVTAVTQKNETSPTDLSQDSMSDRRQISPSPVKRPKTKKPKGKYPFHIAAKKPYHKKKPLERKQSSSERKLMSRKADKPREQYDLVGSASTKLETSVPRPRPVSATHRQGTAPKTLFTIAWPWSNHQEPATDNPPKASPRTRTVGETSDRISRRVDHSPSNRRNWESSEPETLIHRGDWAAQWDEEENDWYFYNYNTDESTWIRPIEFQGVNLENPYNVLNRNHFHSTPIKRRQDSGVIRSGFPAMEILLLNVAGWVGWGALALGGSLGKKKKRDVREQNEAVAHLESNQFINRLLRR